MNRKKILIANHASLFPKTMANQDRVFNMIKRLAQDHIVDVVAPYRNDHELAESRKQLEPICNKYFPLQAINPTDDHLKRKFHRLSSYFGYYIRGNPHLYYYSTRREYTSAIAGIMRATRYDIVQAEYWFMAKCLDSAERSVLKVIDTHDVLFDKLTQTLGQKYGETLPFLASRELARYKELETRYLKYADLLLSISPADRELFARLGIINQTLLIPSGQNVGHFNAFKEQPKDGVILFYGSMGGQENIDAFFRLWHKIFPLIKEKLPNAKILVVGANPPESIWRLVDNKNLSVTGFVDDVRPYLATANVMLLPLDVAAGFRSRVVDVMAMGIPVVGTHKALDCLDMQSSTHGYIADSDEAMASHAITLLANPELRARISDNCVRLATDKYSIDATFGALSDYYSRLN